MLNIVIAKVMCTIYTSILCIRVSIFTLRVPTCLQVCLCIALNMYIYRPNIHTYTHINTYIYIYVCV